MKIGQRQKYKAREQMVDEYIKDRNIYKTQPPLKFDLRGYAKYLRENNLQGKTVDKAIIDMFSK